MRAAWYERQGPAQDVLNVGEMDDPTPNAGEVRIRIAYSGINPGDVKKREDSFGIGMPFPRVVPHSDGAGTVDAIGPGVDGNLVGKRVWCYGAQSYRPFGTAAQFTVVPVSQIVALPDAVSFQVGACLGIPGITAHRAVHVAGPVAGKTVLVQGAAGTVGVFAVQLARVAGARVIGTVRSASDEAVALQAGAHHVLVNDSALEQNILKLCPAGVDHVVEVAFAANIESDTALLRQGGSLAAYATNDPKPTLPFWDILFKNIQINFLGSDDFPAQAKAAAARDVTVALLSEWSAVHVAEVFGLEDIAKAHELVGHPTQAGRVVLQVS